MNRNALYLRSVVSFLLAGGSVGAVEPLPPYACQSANPTASAKPSAASSAENAAAPAAQGQPETKPPARIKLNLPESMEVRLLIDYVSQRLNLNIIYDEKVGRSKITIRTPAEVDEGTLRGLLESVLKMNGLALVETEQKGFLRVEEARSLISIAKSPQGAADPAKPEVGGAPVPPPRGTQVVTQVVEIKHVELRQVEEVLKPFLSQPGANALTVPGRGVVIITDYAGNMERLLELVKLVDRPRREVLMKFLPVKHMEAGVLAVQIRKLLEARQSVEPGRAALGGGAVGAAGAGGAGGRDYEISTDERTNRLIVIASSEQVAKVEQMAAELDVDLGLTTRVYALQSTAPERVDKLVRELTGESEIRRSYRSVIDRDGQMLIVTASQPIHTTVERVKKDLDVPINQQASPIRIHRLYHTTAAEALAVIREVGGGTDLSKIDSILEGPRNPGSPGNPGNPKSPQNPGDTGGKPGERSAEDPGVKNPGSSATGIREPASIQGLPGLPGVPGLNPFDRPGSGSISQGSSGSVGISDLRRAEGEGGRLAVQSFRTDKATITADPNTNSLIVAADPQTHQVYEQLIRLLDKRRPQVLIEVTIVTLDTSNGYSLGVEISPQGSVNGDTLLSFSHFGLSKVNAATGQLSIIPGLGFNGALVSSSVADIVIRALSTNGRARVVSSPRILVNDHATGTLQSINEAPYTSVNASDTVATTSFGGFASAGTSITVTPHISEKDHLQLDYTVALNSFTGEGSTGVPPPRQTNSLQSKVTVPDGDTIIIGGLNRQDQSEEFTSIPFIDQIPILKEIYGNRKKNQSNSTLFVFIKPVILRDDEFEDLKYFSDRDAAAAGLDPSAPASEPLTMRSRPGADAGFQRDSKIVKGFDDSGGRHGLGSINSNRWTG